MLWRFFEHTTPDQVTPAVVLAYAHGIGLSGKPPSPVTIAARIACLQQLLPASSSGWAWSTSNPCDLVERPRTEPCPCPWLLRRRGQTAPRGRARHRPGTTGPGHPPGLHPHRQTAFRGDGPQGQRHHHRGQHRLLLLPGQGRQARAAGTATTGLGGHPADARGLRQGAGDDGPGGVALAGRGRPEGSLRARRSTLASAATSSQQGCSRPGCTSSATAPRSSGVMPGSRSRRSAPSSTTRRWR